MIEKIKSFYAKRIYSRLLPAFSVFVCLVLLIGWRLSRHELITPKHGAGYLLGPVGVILVIVLMIYPLKKRIKTLAVPGSAKQWFQFHMFLGVVGPLFILYHANFHFGALNSNVALLSLLIVSASGVVGKYFYGRIHRTLYGERTSLLELQKTFDQQKEEVEIHLGIIPGVREELGRFAAKVSTPTKELMLSFKRLCLVRWEAQVVRWKIRGLIISFLDQHAKERQWSPLRKRLMRAQMARKTLKFLGQTLKVAEFNFYERVFSYWHMLHLPLVFILAFAVLFHVLAVNRY
ncbi:MAG: hypothetical protein WCO69_01000 [Candidatus Omnitrophota bacterium]